MKKNGFSLVKMNRGNFFAGVFVLQLIVITKSIFIDDDGTYYRGDGNNELFGDGEFEEQEYEDYVSKSYNIFETMARKNPIFQGTDYFLKHQSSSTEDLMILFEAEKNLTSILNSTKHEPKSVRRLVDSFLNQIDYK